MVLGSPREVHLSKRRVVGEDTSLPSLRAFGIRCEARVEIVL